MNGYQTSNIYDFNVETSFILTFFSKLYIGTSLYNRSFFIILAKPHRPHPQLLLVTSLGVATPGLLIAGVFYWQGVQAMKRRMEMSVYGGWRKPVRKFEKKYTSTRRGRMRARGKLNIFFFVSACFFRPIRII